MIPEQVWDADPIPARRLFPGRATGSAMPLAWAHAEFVKLLVSRETGHVFARPRAVWQRYRGRPPRARYAFWWPHAPIAAFRSGARLAVALPEPAIVHWGYDGWQRPGDTPTVDTKLGFHVAALDTAAVPTGRQVNFTWRRIADGGWAAQDVAVRVIADPIQPADGPARGAGEGI